MYTLINKIFFQHHDSSAKNVVEIILAAKIVVKILKKFMVDLINVLFLLSVFRYKCLTNS